MKNATAELQVQLEKHQKEMSPFSAEITQHANQRDLAASEVKLLQDKQAEAKYTLCLALT